jgi:hypothetical protein
VVLDPLKLAVLATHVERSLPSGPSSVPDIKITACSFAGRMDARRTRTPFRADPAGSWRQLGSPRFAFMMSVIAMRRLAAMPRSTGRALTERIGHSDVAFTMRQYVQTDLEAQRQVATTLAELILGGLLASSQSVEGPEPVLLAVLTSHDHRCVAHKSVHSGSVRTSERPGGCSPGL